MSPKFIFTVPTDTGTHDIPEHFCLILGRVVLVLEWVVHRFGSGLINSFRNRMVF